MPGSACSPSAPESAFFFSGNGRNVIYIDWANDVVAVIRWIREGNATLNDIVAGIIGSIDAPARQAAR